METQERGAEANAELLALHRIDETSTRLQQQGKYLEALECMERGLVLRQHFFGPSSDEVWAACKTVGQMCNLLAMTYLQQEEFSMVLELLKKAEILTERDEHGRAVTYNNLACYFRRTGKLHAALQYLQKALKVESRLENVTNRADTHLNLCAVLSQLGRHAGALEHAQAALIQLQEELFPGALSASAKSSSSAALASTDRIAVLAIAYHNIGVEQEFLKRFEMAIDSYRKGVDISETHLGTDHGITVTLRNSYLAARQAAESARARRGPAARPSRRVAPKKTAKTAKTAKRSPRLQQREERRWSDIQKAYGDVSAGLKPDPTASSEFNLHVDYQEQQLELQMQRDIEKERRLHEKSQADEPHDGEGKISDDAFHSSHHSLMAEDDQEINVNETHQDPEDEEKSGEAEEPERPVGASSRNTSRAPSLQKGIAEMGDADLSENLASARAELASVHDLITPRDESALEILENEAAAATEAANKSSILMREDANDDGVEEKGDDDDEREIDDAREGKMSDDTMETPDRESKYAEVPAESEDQGDQEEKSEVQTEKPHSGRGKSTKSIGDTTQDEEKSTSSYEEKRADIVENFVPEEHEYDDDDDDDDDGNDNIEEKLAADSDSAPAESKSEEGGTKGGGEEEEEQTNVEMAGDIEESTLDTNVEKTGPQNEIDEEENLKGDEADHQRDCKQSGMNEDSADGVESASLSPTNEKECDQEDEESKQAEQVSGGNDKDADACVEGSA